MFLVALACGFIASFSSVQGMLVWPCGFVFWAIKRLGNLRVVVKDWRIWCWNACALAASAVYFALLRPQGLGGQSPGGIIKQAASSPEYDLKFMLVNLGAVFQGVHANAALLLGSGILFLIAVALFHFWVSEYKSAYALPMALLTFGLLYDGLLVFGRAPKGIDWAFDSHYTAYNLLTLVGLYLCFMQREFLKELPGRVNVGVKVAVGGVLAMFIFQNARNALIAGGQWRLLQWENVRELKNCRQEAHFKIERTVFRDYDMVAAGTDFLKSSRLSFFHEPEAAIPPDVSDLMTPPASYAAFVNEHPGDQAAMERLWDVYSIGIDLQKAFDVRSASFVHDLVRWAAGDAKHKDHYLHEYLEPYAAQYIGLYVDLLTHEKSEHLPW